MKAPRFWYNSGISSYLMALLLSPLGRLYSAVVNGRLKWTQKSKVDVPVICVGNLSLGGVGKTPTVMALVDLLKEWGYIPHILSRGYGSQLKGPILVDPDHHTAKDVGDEPLLLATKAPTWIGKNRVLSAQEAIKKGATILVMDDGLQNPYLYQDLKIAVFDGTSKIGNRFVFPAGPLRQSLTSGLQQIDLALLIQFTHVPKWLNNTPHIHGSIETTQSPNPDKNYIAFAGIGNPEKFFKTLRDRNYCVHKKISFADHHVYTEADCEILKSYTHCEKNQLITTQKDVVKLPLPFKESVDVLKIQLKLQNEQLLKELIQKNCKKH